MTSYTVAFRVDTPTPDSTATYRRLRVTNGALALVHAAQAALMLVLSTSFSLPVTTTFWNGPPEPGIDPDRFEELFSLRVGPAVAAFLGVSALFHLLIASVLFHTYTEELRRGQNRLRWIEYSLSASLMVVLIAQLTGISDVGALIALFGVNAAMILFGWLMETTNPRSEPISWTPFTFGCVAGAVPWVAIGVYLIGPGGDVPGFVYGIFISLFVFFNCFALNQFLQYRQIGPWRNYLFGERVYVLLSLIAKSALAWQVFANVLV
jgi:hypothetical protein